MPRPNWFFGFPIDGSFLLHLPDAPECIRRFHPDDVHVTLAFLGGCGEEGATRALAALDECLTSAPPAIIDGTLGEVVPMGGSRRDYSALSALLARGREEATALLASLRDPLADAANTRRETRPPKPHVTIARPRRRATPAERKAGLSWAGALDLHAIPARLERVALYTWSEDRRERAFRIVAERRFDAFGRARDD
jgi:2'-5' RNA ligase